MRGQLRAAACHCIHTGYAILFGHGQATEACPHTRRSRQHSLRVGGSLVLADASRRPCHPPLPCLSLWARAWNIDLCELRCGALWSPPSAAISSGYVGRGRCLLPPEGCMFHAKIGMGRGMAQGAKHIHTEHSLHALGIARRLACGWPNGVQIRSWMPGRWLWWAGALR